MPAVPAPSLNAAGRTCCILGATVRSLIIQMHFPHINALPMHLPQLAPPIAFTLPTHTPCHASRPPPAHHLLQAANMLPACVVHISLLRVTSSRNHRSPGQSINKIWCRCEAPSRPTATPTNSRRSGICSGIRMVWQLYISGVPWYSSSTAQHSSNNSKAGQQDTAEHQKRRVIQALPRTPDRQGCCLNSIGVTGVGAGDAQVTSNTCIGAGSSMQVHVTAAVLQYSRARLVNHAGI